MSSALLYLAIVAIWACVLVPRWLRRDPAAVELSAEDSADEVGYLDAEEEYEDEDWPAAEDWAAAEESPAAKEPSRPAPDDHEGHHPVVRRPDPGESRRRVLAARRRLLVMLLLLAAAASCLAMAGLAAWWVVLPPVLMLAGYLLLLREASKSDAERARDAERALGAERPVPEYHAPAGSYLPPGPARRPVRGQQAVSHPPVPVPEADVIDISAQVGEDFYDQYTDARLRAVGD